MQKCPKTVHVYYRYTGKPFHLSTHVILIHDRPGVDTKQENSPVGLISGPDPQKSATPVAP